MSNGVTYRLVERGDTLWWIATTYGKYISGSTTSKKIDTLVSINKIKDRNLIYVGQKIYFSSSGSSGGSSSASTNREKVSFKDFALISSFTDASGNYIVDETGRKMVANWNWARKSETKEFKARWVQYVAGAWVVDEKTVSEWEEYAQSTFDADPNATMVQLKVLPIPNTYKGGKDNQDDIPYWTTESEPGKGDGEVKWNVTTAYEFKNNPPLKPDVPQIKIEDKTLTITLDEIDIKALDATNVEFNIVKDNKTSIHTSSKVAIKSGSNVTDTPYYYAEHIYNNVEYGSTYKVRARSVKTINGTDKRSGWTDFSETKGTRPSAPVSLDGSRKMRVAADGSTTIFAHLEWSEVPNAESYIVQYTTVESDFENGETLPEITKDPDTGKPRTSVDILDLDVGHDYYFRVRAKNSNSEEPSAPSPILHLPIGQPPAAPTTWSTPSKSVFVGEELTLNWMHNARDNSKQTGAQLKLTITKNGEDPFSPVIPFLVNNTDSTDPDEEIQTFTYGEAISYKGDLHVRLNTNHPDFKNAQIDWSVQTAGVVGLSTDDSDWSVPRTVYVYEIPELNLSVVKDLDDGSSEAIDTLDSFPFAIRADVTLTDHFIQRPVGYHLMIISESLYETADETGRTKIVNPGDSVYSKYFDGSSLDVTLSANDIDLEPGINYTVQCAVDMSTGLSTSQYAYFTVIWDDTIEYTIHADLAINEEAYTALITPYCLKDDGELVEDVDISIYRRTFEGSYVEIAKNVPNNRTSVTDPHPALDYARYRLVARDVNTGAISFYDMAGYPINGTSIVIQWDEAWEPFDVTGEHDVDGSYGSGSMLVLKYNVDVADSRKRDVEFVDYAGREHSVSYYGTKITETPQWAVTIPTDDVETIYALRRLSLWKGDVYIREPSGMGYWANVGVNFNLKGTEVATQVTLSITRVEGGA